MTFKTNGQKNTFVHNLLRGEVYQEPPSFSKKMLETNFYHFFPKRLSVCVLKMYECCDAAPCYPPTAAAFCPVSISDNFSISALLIVED